MARLVGGGRVATDPGATDRGHGLGRGGAGLAIRVAPGHSLERRNRGPGGAHPAEDEGGQTAAVRARIAQEGEKACQCARGEASAVRGLPGGERPGGGGADGGRGVGERGYEVGGDAAVQAQAGGAMGAAEVGEAGQRGVEGARGEEPASGVRGLEGAEGGEQIGWGIGHW